MDWFALTSRYLHDQCVDVYQLFENYGNGASSGVLLEQQDLIIHLVYAMANLQHSIQDLVQTVNYKFPISEVKLHK